jgi:hypothetical protein
MSTGQPVPQSTTLRRIRSPRDTLPNLHLRHHEQLACFSLRTRAQSPLQLPKAPFFSSVFPLFLPFLVGVLQNRRESLKSTPIVQLHLKLSSNTPFELFSVRFCADSIVLPDRYASPIFDLLSTVSSLCLATSLPIRRLRSARSKKFNLESFHPRKSCVTTFLHL